MPSRLRESPAAPRAAPGSARAPAMPRFPAECRPAKWLVAESLAVESLAAWCRAVPPSVVQVPSVVRYPQAAQYRLARD